jgi:hypothetical protein
MVDDEPQINLPANAKYLVLLALVLVGVRSDEDMFGKFSNIKFVEYDIMDTQKFPELVNDQYLCRRTVLGMGGILVEPQDWASVLQKEGILNLYDIPHFGWSTNINACVKVLLICVHGGTLWLDPPVSIDTALIARITGFPKAGEDLGLLFLKMGERALFE